MMTAIQIPQRAIWFKNALVALQTKALRHVNKVPGVLVYVTWSAPTHRMLMEMDMNKLHVVEMTVMIQIRLCIQEPLKYVMD